MTIEEIDRHLSYLRKKYHLKSFFRKAKRLVVDFIPLSEIPQVYYTTIKTARESTWTLAITPKTFTEASRKISVQLDPVKIYGLKNVYLTPDSTYFLTTKLDKLFYENVEEFSADYTLLYNSKNLLFHGHRLAKINNLPKETQLEEVIFLGGTFSFNYFHFLIEILPKFQFLKEVPEHNATLVTPLVIRDNPNLKELLSFFAGDRKVDYLDPEKYYHYHKVWHITYPNSVVPNIGEGEYYRAEFTKFSRESVSYVRSICLKAYKMTKVSIELVSRIFLARRSQFRKYNESELLEIATEFGFQAVFLEDLNIHEQIFLMQNAEYVIGPSGAAWTNIIFAQPGRTKGLVWLGNVWKDFSAFSTLADYVEFDLYHYRFDYDLATFHSDYRLSGLEFKNQLTKLITS